MLCLQTLLRLQGFAVPALTIWEELAADLAVALARRETGKPQRSFDFSFEEAPFELSFGESSGVGESFGVFIRRIPFRLGLMLSCLPLPMTFVWDRANFD